MPFAEGGEELEKGGGNIRKGWRKNSNREEEELEKGGGRIRKGRRKN